MKNQHKNMENHSIGIGKNGSPGCRRTCLAAESAETAESAESAESAEFCFRSLWLENTWGTQFFFASAAPQAADSIRVFPAQSETISGEKLEKQFKDAILAYCSGFCTQIRRVKDRKWVRENNPICKISSSSADAVMSEFLWGWRYPPGISMWRCWIGTPPA